jgi:hypothetical protein
MLEYLGNALGIRRDKLPDPVLQCGCGKPLALGKAVSLAAKSTVPATNRRTPLPLPTTS